MSTFLVCALALAAPPADGGTPSVAPPSQTTGDQPPVVLRTGPELRGAVHAALRRWARPSDAEARPAARQFLVLYHELKRDEELAASSRAHLLAKVRGRLLKLGDQIAKGIARQKRLADAEAPETVETPGNKDELAQQFGGFGQRGGMFGQAPQRGGFGGGMFGGPMQDDNGEQLVELIQTTIAPTTWDTVGGPGTIYYWRPGRALVVRQMGEVHDQIGDLLQQLQRAGR